MFSGNPFVDFVKTVPPRQRLEVGGPEATLREELMSAMTRCASLEQNESVAQRHGGVVGVVVFGGAPWDVLVMMGRWGKKKRDEIVDIC